MYCCRQYTSLKVPRLLPSSMHIIILIYIVCCHQYTCVSFQAPRLLLSMDTYITIIPATSLVIKHIDTYITIIPATSSLRSQALQHTPRQLPSLWLQLCGPKSLVKISNNQTHAERDLRAAFKLMKAGLEQQRHVRKRARAT